MRKANLAFFFMIIFSLTLTGCAGLYDVRIDSIKSYDAKTRGNRILMIPVMKDVNTRDLHFKEAHLLLMRALMIAGYDPDINDVEDIDLGILFHYGIGEPKTEYFSYSIPIVGQTGGGTSSFSAQTFGSTGFSSTTGYIYRTPTYGIIGAYAATGSRTTYPKWMILDAIDYREFRKSHKIVSVWKTTIVSRGASDDLRRALPVMLGAAQDYIGADTGGKIRDTIDESDTRVKRIKTPVR